MEASTRRKVQLGVMVVIGTALFITGIFYIGAKQSLFTSTFRISTIFNDANGVRKGDYVWFSGVKVGVIDQINFISDTAVQVQMKLENRVKPLIKKNAIAHIASEGLVGNKIIQIKPGAGDADPIADNDTIQSIHPLDFDAALRNLSKTNDNFVTISEQIAGITKKINEGKGLMNDLFVDTALAKKVNVSLSNVKTASQRSVDLIHSLDDAVKQFTNENSLIGTLTTDTALATQFESFLTNLKTASDQAVTMTKSIDDLATQAKEGQGTISVLLSDTTLANDLKESVSKLNEDLEAIQHNFLFKGYFKKKEKVNSKP